MGKWGGKISSPPRGEFWEAQGGGQQEEGKDLRRLVDSKGSADTRESDKFSRGSRFPVTEFWLHQGAPSFTDLDRQGPIMWEIFPDTWIWSHFLQVPTPLPTPTLEKGASIFLEQGPHIPLLPKEKWCPQGLGPPGLGPPHRVSATPAIFAGRSPDMSKW